MTRRAALVACALLVACGGRGASPRPRVLDPGAPNGPPAAIDSGRVVRLRSASGAQVIGVLQAAWRTASDSLHVRACARPTPARCRALASGDGDTTTVRSFAVRDLHAIWVSDRPVHPRWQLATLLGMLAGGYAAGRGPDGDLGGGGMALGGGAGFLLGTVAETRAWYWQQVHP